jgi:hypothetical protein
MTIIRLNKLLNQAASGNLDKIIQRAQDMQQLTTALRAALPEEMRQNLLAANLREDGELVLVCASSAWASRIRFETEHLLAVVRDTGLTAHACRVTVSQNS